MLKRCADIGLAVGRGAVANGLCFAVVVGLTSLENHERTRRETVRHATTAEGVETEEELAAVREAGCSEVQGYLFARPMAAEAARAFLLNGRQRAA
ncbi:EAL domain-containing protein [Lutibaculum baratangense]|uniref:EAL domain-containing protein n=1 Tax=Lutibaculum baratangense AMV1 TaxID=631454 RepID=V4RH18_9HYPH|nr:hypothetical protein N177_3721 [Lutibaculum baratangense AMV1]